MIRGARDEDGDLYEGETRRVVVENVRLDHLKALKKLAVEQEKSVSEMVRGWIEETVTSATSVDSTKR